MRAHEAVKLGPFTASGASATFQLGGGAYRMYGVLLNKSGLTARLGMVGPDGSTHIDMSGVLSDTGALGVIYLPPGQYHFDVIGTAGASETWYLAIARVPYE